MRWSPPRSLAVALAGLTLGALQWMASPPAHGQDPPPPAAAAPDADLTKRIEKLDSAINQHLDRGQIAEAVPPAREKLELLARTRGQDHWQTGDARRDLETYQRLAGLPREVQDRYAKAHQANARGEQLYGRGQFAEAATLWHEALKTRRDILGEGHTATATSYNNLASNLLSQGKSAEAEVMHRRALAIYLKALGEGHPDTAQSYNNLASALNAQGKYAEAEAMHRHALAIRLKVLGEGHPGTAQSYNNLASALNAQGKSGEAEAMHRLALAILLKAQGEGHPLTALSYNNLAHTLFAQGKCAEAEALLRRALAIKLKAQGADHHDTALSYDNLAVTLRDLGKYAEVEAMQRRALAIYLKTLGEDHPNTAISYHNLAATLRAQGKLAEAEAMHRRALALKLKALGEGHHLTAVSYSSLASTLAAQGKYAEAEALRRRALALQLKALGEDHPDTANGYDNLAASLRDQGKYGEAEAMHRHALTIYLKARGEDHSHTAASYDTLAATLRVQGKLGEAEAMHRLALSIYLKARGEDHRDTAQTYNNLAVTLGAQGKSAEAESLHRRALAIYLKTLGEDHPGTATSYANLAWSLDRQGKHDDALRTWSAAAASYDQSRLLGAKGLDAALTAGKSPLPSFALALARAGRPRDAWTRWEQGLARGLVDEVTGRAARPLTAAEHDQEALLLGQAQALDERIGKLLALKALSQEQDKLLEDLNRQASEIRRQVLELEQQFESKYRALAGQPATIEGVQKALTEGTALIGWVDQDPYHWACLLRDSGDPVWVRLPGSGQDGAWTKEEQELTQRLRAELNPETTKGHARPLAEGLARQRLEPLKAHLRGINRLVVVTSPGLAGVPIDVLLAARPDPSWDGVTVSYAPSASMFTYIVGKPSPRDRAPTLLALADPAYPEAKYDAPAPTPPDTGLAIARVVPNGNADLYGIRAGDVLLAYAGTTLKQHADLKTVPADQGPKKVSVQYWREGITREVEVAAGPLGVMIDNRPAKAVVLAGQAAEQVLLGMRGGSHQRLPGTRREVEAVARLFPAGTVTTLMGEQACESTVQDLARSGRMKGFRYLHFATHGESDPLHAYRSALNLAPDPDRSADPLVLEGDGTITAEQIARTWELDADLVVLSACESGLGRAAGGEGYLGFAQPLFAKGARSLVLSLWKVDDDATALLMTRFYQNLLGARAGLKSPLGKAEALAEAKAWLRGAGPEEVGAALAALPRGPIVRREAVAPKTAARPYEDPTYWAGFILIGSPD
jgi:tetratricopeptide (TPR) repeat protein